MIGALTHKRITERAMNAIAQGHVDAENGILYGVKLLGGRSKNGREYTERAMQNAVDKYRGKKVFIDHPERDRMNEDRSIDRCVGVIESPRFENGAIYGDLRLRKASPYYEQMLEIASDFGSSFGMSHVADGNGRTERGIEIVEEITDVFSVDVVCEAATTAGFFESAHAGKIQNEIDRLFEDSKQLHDKVLEKVTSAYERSDKSISDAIVKDIQYFGLNLSNWLNNFETQIAHRVLYADDASRLIGSLVKTARDPLSPGAPEFVCDLLDELVSFVGGLAAGDAIPKPAAVDPAIVGVLDRACAAHNVPYRPRLRRTESLPDFSSNPVETFSRRYR